MTKNYGHTPYKHRRYGKRNGSSGPPQKGRIRLVLFLILVSFFFSRVIIPSFRGEVEPPKRADQTPVKDDARPDTTEPSDTVPTQEVALDTSATLPPSFSLTHDDLPQLLKSASQDFTGTPDTLVWQDRSMIVHYSMKPRLNRLGKSFMESYRPRFGAVVLFQPKTGRILSLSSYENPDNPESMSEFSTPVYTNASIPAASIAKIVTATAAVEILGHTEQHVLRYHGDKYTLEEDQLQQHLSAGIDISLRRAFAESINPVFGTMGIFELGANNLYTYAQNFGFNTKIPFMLPVDTSVFHYPQTNLEIAQAASGFSYTNTISPIHGALMAGAIANQGIMLTPTIVDSVIDLETEKQVYARSDSYWRRAFKAKNYPPLNEMMKDVSRYGTATSAFTFVRDSPRFRDFHYGGKTGTLTMAGYGLVDWFVGYLLDEDDVEQNVACAVVMIKPPRWQGRSSYIGAELMRRHVMNLQEQVQHEQKDTAHE
ncbi:penicillin-binding transpeptidase domain-containing protein [Chitinivibrio alkaliphilus]|uniref:Penicillin-binding protein transpeptidase domain-containing protein n=1 Tax=Chitinivibrio alkaliphilus ACht1 TaxID=1313304 RepID=U7D6H1_9BACT|nr:penicillin-binding transpeptidase domain-containing protein [Chitinivibrio alkaliphilus]ERP31533.1 penicillin-binding protein transpeptidase domain-containing protein [Chitinivibrio alkaliphilus ACht1]